MKLAIHSSSNLFGTFLCNTDEERVENKLAERTLSIWYMLNERNWKIRNPSYSEKQFCVLALPDNLFQIRFWSELYEEIWLPPSSSRPLEDSNTAEHKSTNQPTLNGVASASASPVVKILAQSDLNENTSSTVPKQNGNTVGSNGAASASVNHSLVSPPSKPVSRVESPAFALGSVSPVNRTHSLVRLTDQLTGSQRALFVRPLSPTSPTAQADRYSSTSSLSRSYSETNLFEVVMLTSCSPQVNPVSPTRELFAGDSIGAEESSAACRRLPRDARCSVVSASAINTPEKPFARAHPVRSPARPISALPLPHRFSSPNGALSRGSTDSPAASFFLPDSESPDPTITFGPAPNGPAGSCSKQALNEERPSTSFASIESLGRDTPNTSITNLATIDAGSVPVKVWSDVGSSASNALAALLDLPRAHSALYLNCFVEDDGLLFPHAVDDLVNIKRALENERLRHRNPYFERNNRVLRHQKKQTRSSFRHADYARFRALDAPHSGGELNGASSSALMTGERCTSLEELEEQAYADRSGRELLTCDYPLAPNYPLAQSPSGPASLTSENGWVLDSDSFPIVTKWMSNDLAKGCARCGAAFSILWRKHHCRCCGLVVCDRCSQHAVPLPEQQLSAQPVRVCHSCYRRIGMENGVLVATRPIACRKTISMELPSSAENVSHVVHSHLMAPSLNHAHSASGPVPYNAHANVNPNANGASLALLASYSPTLESRWRNSSLLGDAQAPDVHAFVATSPFTSLSTSSIPISCRVQNHVSLYPTLISEENSLVVATRATELPVSALLVNGCSVHPAESHSVEVLVGNGDNATYRSTIGSARSTNNF